MKNNADKFLELFRRLNHNLNNYYIAYKELKRYSRKFEADKNNIEFKRIDAERRIKASKEDCDNLLTQIDKLFNNSYFAPVNEEMKNEIGDEFIGLVNNIRAIEDTIQIPSTKNNPKIMEMHVSLIDNFQKLENNISVYNHTVEQEHWKFKFIEPEEAHKRYNKMSKEISDKWEKNFKKNKNENLVYMKPKC